MDDGIFEIKMEVDSLFPEQDQLLKCLICSRDDTDSGPRPLTGLGLLPKPLTRLRSPETVEDDMRSIYLLKILFQLSTAELTHLMELSNGECPRQWIHICESCLPLVLEMKRLDAQINECRAKIKKTMIESSCMAPDSVTMTKRIQNLVSEQVTRVKAAFSDGDREAERLVNLKMQSGNEFDEDDHQFGNGDATDSEGDTVQFDNELELKPNHKGRPPKKVRHKKKLCPPPPAMEESFTCPYCSSGSMNMVDFFYHLIYHYDYPMSCSECKVFLPRNSSDLDAHWQQYHCDMETTLEMRFIDLLAAEVHIDEQEFPPPEKKQQRCFIKCGHCAHQKFDSITKFKLHQALRHPQVARSSCPICLEKVKTKTALARHLKLVHGTCFQRLRHSHLCKFCGERLHISIDDDGSQKAKWRLNEALIKIQKLHVMSCHPHLINATYTCTQCQCSQECSHLKEFINHTGNHDINWNANATKLCSFSGASITCELCAPGTEEDPGIFVSVRSFLCHLTLSHSLYLKWIYDPMKPSARDEVIWKSIEEHVKQMKASRRLADVLKMRSTAVKEKQASHSKWKAKYEATRPPRYSCPACPELRKMNVDHFIVHLLYHWRHPNKCTSCNLLLPFSTEAVEEHWKQYHPESHLDTSIKFEAIQFTPGDIFGCQGCAQRFASFRDRNHHEQSSHENTDGGPKSSQNPDDNNWSPKNPFWGSSMKTRVISCSVCGEHFVDAEEVRLHKAIDHPQVSCVSCFYCDTVFAADSVEGGQYLDSEALEQHISEMEDHPKDEAGTPCHLYACEICGEVIPDRFKNGKRVRSHVSTVHGKEYLKTSFMCFICNKAVQFHLWTHLSGRHAKNCICENCGEEMRPHALPDHSLVAHNIIMEGYTEFRCGEEGCAYKTVHSEHLKFHLNTNHNAERERKHKCSFCEKAFFCSRALREHEERHTNRETKPHQCEICGSSFAVRNYLYIHKRLSHLNQKFPSTNRKRSRKET